MTMFLPVLAKACGDYSAAMESILSELDLLARVRQYPAVVIKPNLVEDAPHPVTTDVRCVEAIIRYLKDGGYGGRVTVAEGSGGGDTFLIMKSLGYGRLSAYGVDIVDLDRQGTWISRNDACTLLKELYLPETVKDSFVVSVACLKEHSITGVSLSLKNLVGCLPEKYYGGYWSYKKSQIHKYDEHEVICDINRHLPAGLAVIDGRIGQKGSHLKGGKPMNPPCDRLLVSYSAVACDTAGCRLLGRDPDSIKHIKLMKEAYGGKGVAL